MILAILSAELVAYVGISFYLIKCILYIDKHGETNFALFIRDKIKSFGSTYLRTSSLVS